MFYLLCPFFLRISSLQTLCLRSVQPFFFFLSAFGLHHTTQEKERSLMAIRQSALLSLRYIPAQLLRPFPRGITPGLHLTSFPLPSLRSAADFLAGLLRKRSHWTESHDASLSPRWLITAHARSSSILSWCKTFAFFHSRLPPP